MIGKIIVAKKDGVIGVIIPLPDKDYADASQTWARWSYRISHDLLYVSNDHIKEYVVL